MTDEDVPMNARMVQLGHAARRLNDGSDKLNRLIAQVISGITAAFIGHRYDDAVIIVALILSSSSATFVVFHFWHRRARRHHAAGDPDALERSP